MENRFGGGGLAGSEKAWVLGWDGMGWDFPVLGVVVVKVLLVVSVVATVGGPLG